MAKHVQVVLTVVLDRHDDKEDATAEHVAEELRAAVEEEMTTLWVDSEQPYDVRFVRVDSFGTTKPPEAS